MPPGERMPLHVGTIVPSGLTRSAQPRKGDLAGERAGEAEHDPEVAALSKREPKAYSW